MSRRVLSARYRRRPTIRRKYEYFGAGKSGVVASCAALTLGGRGWFRVSISHAVFGEDLSDYMALGYGDGSVAEASDVPLQVGGGEYKFLDFVFGS